MSELLKRFRRDVKSAVTKGMKAERNLVARLMAMTPEEFARVPRALLDRLSDEDYRAVVGRISPDHRLAQPAPEEKPARRRRSLRDLWMALPVPLRAVLLGGGYGSALLVIILLSLPAIDWWRSLTPPVRPRDVMLWPACRRLDGWADGCTYRTTVERDWGTIARQLGLPVTYVRIVNRHIDARSVPAGTLLVVWRERGIPRRAN